MDRLRNMLADQLNVQAVIQPETKPLNEMIDVNDRIEAIRYNYIALVQELSEAMNEVGWKSWATSRHINQEMFGELRDVLQFLINLMFLATGDTPDQLADRIVKDLKSKHEVNIRRALSRYDGISAKCPTCKRALDEISLTIIRKPNDVEIDRVFCVCGAQLTIELVEPYLRN